MVTLRLLAWCVATFTSVCYLAAQPDGIYHVALSYRAPGKGPRTNFSPHGTQVQLSDLPDDAPLPEGAGRPGPVLSRSGPMRNLGSRYS